MTRIRQTRVPMWVQQPDATLSQAPVSGTKYTVLDTVKNARIIDISVNVTWTVQPTPLEVHGTIDGQTHNWAFTDPVSATKYFPDVDPSVAANAQSLTATSTAKYRAFLLEAKSVKIEVEITGGTVSNLSARVKYALRR